MKTSWFQTLRHAMRTLLHAIGIMLREVEYLIAPLLCAGCGADDVELCQQCFRAFGTPLIPVDTDGFPTLASTPYAGTTRNVIARWKDHGRSGLSGPLSQVAARAGTQLGAHVALSVRARDPMHAGGGGAAAFSSKISDSLPLLPTRIVLVPMPSSAAATRERGFEPARVVADGLARGLARSLQTRGVVHSVEVVSGLRFARKKTDQSVLGAASRRKNLRGSLRATSALQDAARAADILLLVDDVVTTGATLTEAKRAIGPLFGTFVAGYSLVMTPRSALTAEKQSFNEETSNRK